MEADKLRALQQHQPSREEADLAGEIMQEYASLGWNRAYRLAKRLTNAGYRKDRRAPPNPKAVEAVAAYKAKRSSGASPDNISEQVQCRDNSRPCRYPEDCDRYGCAHSEGTPGPRVVGHATTLKGFPFAG